MLDLTDIYGSFDFTSYIEERGSRTGLAVEAAYVLPRQQLSVAFQAGGRANGQRHLDGRKDREEKH